MERTLAWVKQLMGLPVGSRISNLGFVCCMEWNA